MIIKIYCRKNSILNMILLNYIACKHIPHKYRQNDNKPHITISANMYICKYTRKRKTKI